VALAGVGALIRLGLEGLGTFDLHGLVEQQAQSVGEAIGALVENEGDDLIEG
jgi:hypothetical protein